MTISEQGAVEMAQNLLSNYGLGDWIVEWDNDPDFAGTSTGNTRKITLSRTLLANRSDDVVIETIRHEVAHALTSGLHDNEWLGVLISLGGTGDPWEELSK